MARLQETSIQVKATTLINHAEASFIPRCSFRCAAGVESSARDLCGRCIHAKVSPLSLTMASRNSLTEGQAAACRECSGAAMDPAHPAGDSHPPEERGPRLKEKLMAEAGAILIWMLKGLADYLEDGLRPPTDLPPVCVPDAISVP
jgi:hypothetical protein